MRAQALAISHTIDPLPTPLPPTRSELVAAQRETATEAIKDRWNQEIAAAVRWVQYTDWDEVRESLEDNATSLWTKTFGNPEEQAAAAKAKFDAAALEASNAVQRKASDVATSAKQAYQQATEKAKDVELTAEDKALEARLKAKKEAVKAERAAADTAKEVKSKIASALERGKDEAKREASIVERAAVNTGDEVKGTVVSALERGKDKAAELLNRAKTTVGIVESKVAEVTADGKLLTPADPVRKALHQRYERPEAKVNKTVAEVLRERYTPVDSRDNTVLRGV